MDRWTRKFIRMHTGLHRWAEVDRPYVSRKEGRKELTRIKDSVNTSMQQAEDSIKKKGVKVIKTTRNNTESIRIKITKITRKQKGKEKYVMDISSDKQVKSHQRQF